MEWIRLGIFTVACVSYYYYYYLRYFFTLASSFFCHFIAFPLSLCMSLSVWVAVYGSMMRRGSLLRRVVDVYIVVVVGFKYVYFGLNFFFHSFQSRYNIYRTNIYLPSNGTAWTMLYAMALMCVYEWAFV